MFAVKLEMDSLSHTKTMSLEAITSLLQQIQTGNEEALLQLHAQYANAVYSVAFRVLNHPQDAEEVTQDVFMRLWHKAASYEPERGTFLTWLLTITRRIAIDRLRSQNRGMANHTVSMDAQSHLWETNLVQEDLSELQRSILSTLEALPLEQQETIKLAYFQSMSHADIAEYLDRPLGTVKSQIRLGMQKLRDLWLNQQVDSEQ